MNKKSQFQMIVHNYTFIYLFLFIIISSCEGHVVQIQSTKTLPKTTLLLIPSLTYATLLPTTTLKPEPTNTPIPFPTNTLIPDRWITNGPNAGLIGTIAIDPTNSSTIYAGSSGFNTIGQGVFKSIDGGRSWVSTSTGISDLSIESIVIDPQNSSKIYVVTNSDGGFQTIDSGKTWQAIDVGLTGYYRFEEYLYALAIDPQTSSIVYAGTDKGLYKSNSGHKFLKIKTSGIPDQNIFNSIVNPSIESIAIDPKTPTTLFVVADYVLGKYVENLILKSIDGGNNWRIMKSNLHIDSPVMLVIDPINVNNIYFGVDDGIYKSTDGGLNWKHIKIGLQYPYLSSLVIDQKIPSMIYAGTSLNGVYKSTDGGQTWKTMNNGLAGDDIHVYSLAIDPINSSIVYAGTMNNVFSLFQQIN